MYLFILNLQEEQDRQAAERRRQAELARLRREKRQAERESKFDEAALVLGLAERNRQNLEERWDTYYTKKTEPEIKPILSSRETISL